ncbi:MAG: UvrD-helicase domain-containing protein [Mariniphaga sp.]|nr:UvrD-helicase domain-containing protein [Mariniphaga sp.]
MLTVYKASAGSGKTFQLVVEYLKILIRNPLSYRGVLAVTFTNKATNEMKSRILEQLYLLAGNKDSKYLSPILKAIPLSEEKVRERARQTLKNILHDYNRFSISTIDTFTQRVIQAFNREMGISPHFAIGLDDDLILEEATDRLLAKVDTDKQIRKWLVKFSDEKIRENRSQRIEEDIKALGKELFREKFQLFFPDQVENNPYTRESLGSFRGELDQLIAWFEYTLKKRGREAVEIIRKNDLDMDDFSGKSRGIGAFFYKMADGEMPKISDKILAYAENVEAWYNKNNKKRDRVHQVVDATLKPLLEEIVSFFHLNNVRYQTAHEVRKQLRTLGIITDLKDEVRNLLLEKEILQLSDSNLLLSKIIGDSDAPFIYEKIGTRFNYFMLDEFQDTSSLQWGNFKPLIANALAGGYSALLVGDVKQSIYRWRNSDWNILATQIETDFPHYPITSVPLNQNWRSSRLIIDFNNHAFGALKQTFETFLFQEIDSDFSRDRFSKVYKEFIQNTGDRQQLKSGCAEVRFLPEENFDKQALSLLVDQVKYLQDNGFEASDIAILIRKNSEGAPIVEAFMEAATREENRKYHLSVLSNESLFLYASRGVNLVMLVVDLLLEPDNKIQQVALLHLWLSWLKPKQKRIDGSGTANQEYESINQPSEWLIDENFEAVYEQEVGPKINQLRQKVMMTSLDEAVTEICSLFGLFQVKSELPFLQTLIDQASEMKSSLANDLSNLLFWWNKKGYKTSVNVNEEVNSVRLLTVHKSKGLEFDAVILPFFNWNVTWTGNQIPLLWCEPDTEPFNRFPLLPVKATKNLENTLFQQNYYEEKVNSFIDTLNMIYVAFTRAKSVLYVNCRKPKDKNSSGVNSAPGKTTNDMLEYALNQIAVDKKFASCWNEDQSIFTYGECPVMDQKEDQSDAFPINTYQHSDFNKRIRVRRNSEEFLLPGEQGRSVKNSGKIVHEILSWIKTAHDIEPACERALREGKVSREEKQEVAAKLNQSMKNPVISRWFSETVQIVNERNLLDRQIVLRPDRLIINGKNAVVVDYKWGLMRPEKYRKQVKRYAGMLKKCGCEKVEGYLWYINQGEVEKVL